MRILFSISNLVMGGAQTFLVSLANEMSKTGKVYIYYYLEGQVDQDITGRISPNIKIFRSGMLDKWAPALGKILSLLKKKQSAKYLLKKFHLRFLVKWLRIDIIHSQLFHSDEFITHVFKNRKIPVLITEHGCYNYVIQEGFATKESIARIFKRINGAAYISEQNKKHIIDLTGNNQIMFRKMNNGIPKVNPDPNAALKLKESLNIKNHDFVFGMVARGIKEKGWEIAAAAFNELQEETDKKIHLIFIGDSSYLQELKIEVERKSIHNIHFLGSISEPIKWISCFDVGLLPSYFAGESLPMAVIEYLACDKPVIATNVGSIKEMVTYEGKCAGIIFEYQNDFKENVKNLKNAMAQYLQNPPLLKKHRLITNQCFGKFDIKNVVLKYLDFYEILINSNN